jgi:HD-like signal output (HDOD) protein
MSFLEAEIQILGFDHAYIAAEACRKWKIPERITKAIRYHHFPSKSQDELLASMLHVADRVAILSGGGSGGDDLLSRVEAGTLERLNLTRADMGALIHDVSETLSKLPE